MAIERARAHAVQKPWGVADLRPWSRADDGARSIGEIWYERSGSEPSDPSLLLKLLFTSQPLSIQVHPDDAYAQSIGLACGKTEAWYILSAAPGARIALGLKKQLVPRQLREAVADGSLADLVAWRTVLPGDVVFVPAGTIHAIGAHLVIAEIQQRSDVTFRMFDFGRARELHIADAVAVADAGPADADPKPRRLTDERVLLASNPHFVLERIELAPGSTNRLEAERETWLLVVSGSARAATLDVATGDAVFAQSDSIDMFAGPEGMAGLVAYTGAGGPVPHLLQRPAPASAADAAQLQGRQVPTSHLHTNAAPAHGLAGATP
ncbi:MAG: class I mannose-6-phosphate isomerase [Hyphomicrobiaceae bacterium]